MWTIFALSYIGIALGGLPGLVLDRSGVAVLGAVAMLVVGGISIGEAAHSIDKPTILLLFGLMLFAAQLRAAGFPVVVDRFLERFFNRPKLLLAGVIAVSAIVSALLANDIVCLAFTPLLCQSLLQAKKDPVPYLLALAMASNIGSAATIIGNPQNMYIGSVASLHFGRFAVIMIPPVIAGLGLCWVTIVLLFHQRLATVAATPTLPNVASITPTQQPIDYLLIGKTLALVVLLIGFFLYAGADANERAIGALAGAGILLFSSRKQAEKLQQLADWNLLLLFLGLFVLNGAMRDRHLIENAFHHVAALGLHLEKPIALSATTTVLSNLVSNVPAVLLLQPTVQASAVAQHSNRLWYLLALVSTWAGNLTLVGSIANLIVAESAATFGVKIDLKTYCKAGVPLTILTVALGTVWIMAVM
jgi:Na+/H+ antiporter NhaD/arsenite permease-like protein